VIRSTIPLAFSAGERRIKTTAPERRIPLATARLRNDFGKTALREPDDVPLMPFDRVHGILELYGASVSMLVFPRSEPSLFPTLQSALTVR
jgi:hypothetical protein